MILTKHVMKKKYEKYQHSGSLGMVYGWSSQWRGEFIMLVAANVGSNWHAFKRGLDFGLASAKEACHVNLPISGNLC